MLFYIYTLKTIPHNKTHKKPIKNPTEKQLSTLPPSASYTFSKLATLQIVRIPGASQPRRAPLKCQTAAIDRQPPIGADVRAVSRTAILFRPAPPVGAPYRSPPRPATPPTRVCSHPSPRAPPPPFSRRAFLNAGQRRAHICVLCCTHVKTSTNR